MWATGRVMPMSLTASRESWYEESKVQSCHLRTRALFTRKDNQSLVKGVRVNVWKVYQSILRRSVQSSSYHSFSAIVLDLGFHYVCRAKRSKGAWFDAFPYAIEGNGRPSLADPGVTSVRLLSEKTKDTAEDLCDGENTVHDNSRLDRDRLLERGSSSALVRES